MKSGIRVLSVSPVTVRVYIKRKNPSISAARTMTSIEDVPFPLVSVVSLTPNYISGAFEFLPSRVLARTPHGLPRNLQKER